MKHRLQVTVLSWLLGAAIPLGMAGLASQDQKGTTAGSVWQSLFDGKTLNGWLVTDFAGHKEQLTLNSPPKSRSPSILPTPIMWLRLLFSAAGQANQESPITPMFP